MKSYLYFGLFLSYFVYCLMSHALFFLFSLSFLSFNPHLFCFFSPQLSCHLLILLFIILPWYDPGKPSMGLVIVKSSRSILYQNLFGKNMECLWKVQFFGSKWWGLILLFSRFLMLRNVFVLSLFILNTAWVLLHLSQETTWLEMSVFQTTIPILCIQTRFILFL